MYMVAWKGLASTSLAGSRLDRSRMRIRPKAIRITQLGMRVRAAATLSVSLEAVSFRFSWISRSNFSFTWKIVSCPVKGILMVVSGALSRRDFFTDMEMRILSLEKIRPPMTKRFIAGRLAYRRTAAATKMSR